MSLLRPGAADESARWPSDPGSLVELQSELALARPGSWSASPDVAVGGCFVCFARGGSGVGAKGDPGWAAAVTLTGNRVSTGVSVRGIAGSAYAPGLLASREGALLEKAVVALGGNRPDVLLVNATGRDHPRRAGLALQLGWATDLPSVGVTNRPLLAEGEQPEDSMGAMTPLWIDRDQVGWWLRTSAGALPVAVSPGWLTDLDTAPEVIIASVGRVRTPEPIRQARRVARTARGVESGPKARMSSWSDSGA
jgi:deoxyribonuclease V